MNREEAKERRRVPLRLRISGVWHAGWNHEGAKTRRERGSRGGRGCGDGGESWNGAAECQRDGVGYRTQPAGRRKDGVRCRGNGFHGKKAALPCRKAAPFWRGGATFRRGGATFRRGGATFGRGGATFRRGGTTFSHSEAPARRGDALGEGRDGVPGCSRAARSRSDTAPPCSDATRRRNETTEPHDGDVR